MPILANKSYHMMTSQHPHIGKNMKMLRELRNYTQEYMAEQLGISTPRYCKIEHKEHINTSYLYKISEVLDTDVHRILDFDERIYFDENINDNADILKKADLYTSLFRSDITNQKILHLLQLIEQDLKEK